jgi:hypothetical protein
LFSQPRVADFLNQTFEPVWESVRPVPIVRIDFGNGKVLTRTLHGNILTAICTPDGLLVDALPGIYTESVYLDRLNVLATVARNAQAAAEPRRDVLVRAYHRGQAQALKKNADPRKAAADRLRLAVTKSVIETPIELALLPMVVLPVPPAEAKSETKPALSAAEDVANWKTLQEDTTLNERTRRLQIHELLAGTGLVAPAKVTRPIYKDVLHADLDDPYLGLGTVLFPTYPFAREDAASHGG